MLNSSSPAIYVAELDQTATAPGLSTTVGAFVGNFRWGPAESPVKVSNESELRRIFGTPTQATSVDFHTAKSFLPNALEVVRGISAATRTANAIGATDLVVKSDEDFEASSLAYVDGGMWIARFPGALGNSLKVEVFGFITDTNTTATNFGNWPSSSRFPGPPSTSAYAALRGASNDEVHVAVIDEDGLFSGRAGTILETYSYLSLASDAKKADGESIYLATVLNRVSQYVRFGAMDETSFPEGGDAVTSGVNYGTDTVGGRNNYSLSGGVDSAALGSSEILAGFALFDDPDTIQVDLIICPDLPAGSETTIANAAIDLAETRKDAVAFISPGAAATDTDAIVTFFQGITASSYAVRDSGRIMTYDKYNDELITIPACGAVAALCARTDQTYGPWYSPAGAKRGQIRNVTKLKLNPTKAQRDSLYQAAVNPIVTFPGQGTLLFGDKTGSGRPSAFDRINVRRLFIVLEKSISTVAQDILFEFNDEFTRAQFVAIVEPLLRNIQAQNGIQEFRVVCDTTNNTSDVIDRNELVADIFIKPARSINFIQLNFIATRTSVDLTTTGA